jgi:altronate dehydratase
MEFELSVVDQVADAAVIRLHPRDNVVVASSRLSRNALAIGEGIRALEPIPSGHKMATRRIASGQSILKYGQVIGVGVRNYIGVLTSVNCSATVARHIAEAAERRACSTPIPTSTASCRSPTPAAAAWPGRRRLRGAAPHAVGHGGQPNFGGMLLVGLGCEVIQIGRLKGLRVGGPRRPSSPSPSRRAAARGARSRHGLARLGHAAPPSARRGAQPSRPARLTLGLQCGGSDAWSGVSSNPALGVASDRLVGSAER